MRPALLWIMGVVIGVTGLMTTPARAADAITCSVDVSPAPKVLTGDEWRALSVAGSRILKHADEANTALAEKKNSEALSNIEQGLKLARMIDTALPASTVTTEIASKGFSYVDISPSKPVFVPIFRAFDTMDILSQVAAKKQGKKTAPEVTFAGVNFTSVKLDVRLAKRDLQTAQDFIKQGDIKAAAAALEDIPISGVLVEFDAVSAPLMRAMDNLSLAGSELKANHPDRSKLALAAATDALKTYEKAAGEDRAKDVAKLHTEIDAMAKNLAQYNPNTFAHTISGWWNRCLDWLYF